MIDREKLKYPGDVLHEAGHIATTAPSERHSLTGDLKSDPGDERAAIAWSYAAVVHLRLEPDVLFHGDGYKGDAAHLIESFGAGSCIGVPMLEWYGMTRYQRLDSEGPDYPKMRSWVRTVDPT